MRAGELMVRGDEDEKSGVFGCLVVMVFYFDLFLGILCLQLFIHVANLALTNNLVSTGLCRCFTSCSELFVVSSYCLSYVIIIHLYLI